MSKLIRNLVASVVLPIVTMAAHAADPIKVGVLFTQTGPVGTYGMQQLKAAQMWAEDVNRRGGLAGRPVEIKAYDPEANGTKMVQFLRRLVESDNVDVVLGPSTSGEALLAVPIANETKVAVLSHTTAYAVVNPPTPYMFQPFPTDRLFAPKMLDEFKRRGYKNIGLLNAADGFGQSGASAIKEMAPTWGMTVTQEEYERQDTDMTPQLLRMRQKNIDALVVWGTFPGPPIIMRNAKAIGLNKPIYNSYAMTNKDFIRQSGGAAEGSYVISMPIVSPGRVDKSDPVRAVVEKAYADYLAKYKEAPMGGTSPTFDSGLILEAAVKQIKGPVNRQSIRDAIERTTVVGTNGTFRFSPTNHSGLDEAGLTVIFLKVASDDWAAN
jgi:branched-chain amino acid transport system substrate-binding protein